MVEEKPNSIDPYRVLFPFGIFWAGYGVLLWPAFHFQIINYYPGIIGHPDSMIAGFIGSFISGFLMTAIPRFTGSLKATNREIFISFIMAIFLVIFAILNLYKYFHIVLLFQIIFLFIFSKNRFLFRKFNPPPSFVFVGLGIFSALFGAVVFVLNDYNLISSTLNIIGRNLFFKYMVLSMIIGVGSRLVPTLTGWAETPKFQFEDIKNKFTQTKKIQIPLGRFWIIHISFYFAAILLEAFHYNQLAALILALIITSIFIKIFKINKIPNVKTPFARSIWISCHSILWALWLNVFFNQYSLHILHLLFIAGYGLLTLMISTRVVNSHNGYNVAQIEAKKIYYVVTILCIAAALTRVSAFFIPRLYINHLDYASYTWFLMILYWSYYFLKRVIIQIKKVDH